MIFVSINLRNDLTDLLDIGELTWEQKEQVFRELFARMNGAKANKSDKPKENNKSNMMVAKLNKNLEKFDTDDEDEDFDPKSLKPLTSKNREL